ncbi:MBL fold metallo-hydrolase [Pseudobutyrivibrio xylanivorans]|uniref:MBL fold metallo-hydrolase n=1 Tax=Pseudobutyrivibrio xylanivorans TaxID=185007 RepID=UPI00142F1F6C|nr:MBL fold metallo-hydrolase [Pseudobutyrivibrio xylanivorans]
MEIKQFTWDVVDSNSWLVVEDGHGLLVDAVDSQDLFDTIAVLKDLIVIVTHCHFDHIVGLNKIRELRSDVKAISTEKCSEYLGNVHRNMSAIATTFVSFYDGEVKRNVKIEPFTCEKADDTFDVIKEFEWYGHKVVLEAVYGHGDDGLLVILDNEYLFSGDTLLGIPTVTSFPRGSTKRFWAEDVPRLRKLSKSARTVYPGHGSPGEIADMLGKIIKGRV